MKKHTILASTFVLLVFSGCASTNEPSTINTAPMKEVLSQIEPHLISIARKAEAKGLGLASVTLTFNTTASENAGGELNLLVLSAGAKSSSAVTSEYTVTLTSVEGSEQTSDQTSSFFKSLESILEQSETIAELGTAEIKGTLKYVVKASAEAGLKWELSPVTASIGGSINQAFAQTLVVILKPKKDDGDAV